VASSVWKQRDLYVATVDDFVRAFLHVVNYYQFLKGDIGGTGPTKKELKLRMAERRAKQTGNHLVLEDPMLDMPGADEFCTCEPRMAGEEVFGSSDRKADLPLGVEKESHRPDKVNFSHPRGSGRAVRARPVQMPIILEDTEDDTIVQDIHHEPEPESIPASPPNEGGSVMSVLSRRQRLTSRSGTYQDFPRPR
jgi:hypothetical protein